MQPVCLIKNCVNIVIDTLICSTVLGGLMNNKGLKILNLKLDPKGKDLS